MQIKNVSNSTEITKHFLKNDGKYEMIPVLAPDGTFNSGMLEPYQSLMSYSEVDGLSINTYDEVELLVADQVDKLAAGHYGFIDSGTEIHEFSTKISDYYGFGFDAGIDIPYIGILMQLYIIL